MDGQALPALNQTHDRFIHGVEQALITGKQPLQEANSTALQLERRRRGAVLCSQVMTVADIPYNVGWGWLSQLSAVRSNLEPAACTASVRHIALPQLYSSVEACCCTQLMSLQHPKPAGCSST